MPWVAERCSFGLPFVQADFDEDGKLKATIGAGDQNPHGSAALGDVLTLPSCRRRLEADMHLWLRRHVPLCVGFESGIAGRQAARRQGIVGRGPLPAAAVLEIAAQAVRALQAAAEQGLTHATSSRPT